MSVPTPTGAPLAAPATDAPISTPAADIPTPVDDTKPGLVALGDPDAAVCTEGVCNL